MGKRFVFKGSDVAKMVQQLLAYALTLEADKEYYFDLKRHFGARTLDANAYAWVLIGKLATCIGRDPEDVYREHVRRSGGNYVITPIQDEALDRWGQIWSNKGLGWQTSPIGPCRNTEGYTNVANFYGSSAFDTKEMSNLLENLIYACKEQDIETDTPEQIAKRLEEWPY